MLVNAVLSLFFSISISRIRPVSGHGFIQDLVINGQIYKGWDPFHDPYISPRPDRVVRKVSGDGPITNISDLNLACNEGGERGANIAASVPAGGSVVFQWTEWPSDHLGPVSTYMTSCHGDCRVFHVNGAKWFKIDAAGYSHGRWASARLISANNSWTSIIPQIAPGEYLLRHEIVALHSSDQPQFYPSCSQIRVTGTGTEKPDGKYTVSIPGVYDGVHWPNIWKDFGSFTMPGPPAIKPKSISSGTSYTTTGTKASKTTTRGGHITSTSASRNAG